MDRESGIGGSGYQWFVRRDRETEGPVGREGGGEGRTHAGFFNLYTLGLSASWNNNLSSALLTVCSRCFSFLLFHSSAGVVERARILER